MKTACEGRGYAKIRPGTPQGPEKIGIIFGVSDNNALGRCHYSRGKQIVARSTVQTGEPAQSTAEDETARAYSGTLSEHRREHMPTRSARHLSTQYPTCGADRSLQRIDLDRLH